MPTPEKPNGPSAAQELVRFRAELEQATAEREKEFKAAAREVVLADIEGLKKLALQSVDELAAQYVTAAKKIAALQEKLFELSLKSGAHFKGGETKPAPEVEQVKGQISAMKADALQALSQGVSKGMAHLLKANLYRDKGQPHVPAPGKPAAYDRGKPHKDKDGGPGKDGGDEHSDGTDT
jgi:hypothetical protein